MKTVIVFSPHNDDLEIGLGGTALKLIDEGYKIIKLVFSAGELSNPHLKEEVIIKRREREALAVAKEFGIHETIFYRLSDQKLAEELTTLEKDVRELLRKEKPEQAYIPSETDLHPDHQAVYHFALELLKDSRVELYTYEVWSFASNDYPSIYVDITPYFKKKLDMMRYFSTEKFSITLQMIPIMYRARKYGRKINTTYAEKFARIQ